MSRDERRRSRRRGAPGEHGIVSARVRPGHAAEIVDVSAGGALVETRHRLLPGSSVEIHMETATRRASIRGRVLRCAVSVLQPSCIRYRGAIGFERPFSWFADESSGYRLPKSGKRAAAAPRAESSAGPV